MTSWLVIGGAPSAKEWFPRIKAEKVITCNAGLQVCPNADVYWLSDPVAIHRYKPDWEKFKGEIVCNADIGRERTEFPYLDKGVVFHGRCSGVLCCRVAIARGATELHLIGFEGYRPEDKWQGVDGKPVAERGEQALKVNEAQEVAFWDISKAHPEVKVKVYGYSMLGWPARWTRILELP